MAFGGCDGDGAGEVASEVELLTGGDDILCDDPEGTDEDSKTRDSVSETTKMIHMSICRSRTYVLYVRCLEGPSIVAMSSASMSSRAAEATLTCQLLNVNSMRSHTIIRILLILAHNVRLCICSDRRNNHCKKFDL